MSGITLKNPIVNAVPIAISLGRKSIDFSSTRLSTGLKANNDIIVHADFNFIYFLLDKPITNDWF